MSEAEDFKPSNTAGIPVGDDELQRAPMWATGDAKKEAKNWNDLDQVRYKNDRRWLTTYGFILVSMTVIFAAIFGVSLIVWTVHYVTPWCWLSTAQLDKIQSVLFSGGMGAVISGVIRSQMEKIKQ